MRMTIFISQIKLGTISTVTFMKMDTDMSMHMTTVTIFI